MNVVVKDASAADRPDAEVSSVVAVLAYHKIGDAPPDGWETWFRVSEASFAAHLAYLHDHDWKALSADDLLRALEAPGSLPQRSFCITFDDGFRSVRQVALPHLRQFGYPAVMFVPTDFIGKANLFDADWEPQEPVCDWADLVELERDGVSIQSHGASHMGLSSLGPTGAEADLARSKSELERNLGRAVELYAYPYGDAGRDAHVSAQLLSRIGYRAAFVYQGEPIRLPVPDRYRVQRVPVGSDTELSDVLVRFEEPQERNG